MNGAPHRLAQLTACATLVLLVAGNFVTATGSSLAVPDWPLSYGQLFPPMVGGIFYEHGHRMIAAGVAILTAALAAWLQAREPRTWVRGIGWVALAAVLAQAVLGGLTVLFLLPPAISVGHAALAMLFFCLVTALALFTSPGWSAAPAAASPGATSPPLGLAATTTGVLYLQILVGALVRHTGAALAIPTFPLAFGRLVPPLSSFPVQVSFAHRVGAVVVALFVLALAAQVALRHRDDPRLVRPAALLLGLLLAQIALGGFTIWTAKAVLPTVAHGVAGALMLVVALRVTLQAWRLRERPVAGTAAVGRLAVA